MENKEFFQLYHRIFRKTTFFTGKLPQRTKNIFRFPLYKGIKDCYNSLAEKQMHRWLNG